MKCPYIVGQKVTPTREVIHKFAIQQGMKEGEVYTVSWIGLSRDPYIGEQICVKFRELPPRPDGKGWWWKCFKPATDISMLTALLNTQNTPAPTPELV